ncbi:MAG TPA: glucans biosynthesis glucosyltransferase MdoH [Opitutaceae bacterium]|nr:glucans biosynthesis glucosyltransferase MdoH [Opitutaceae bacterium]
MAEPSTSQAAAVARVSRRRMGVLTVMLVLTGVSTLLMADLIWGMPMRGWNGVLLALFALLSALISFGATQAAFGFIARRFGGDPCRLACTLSAAEEAGVALAPTAIVMTVCNEEVARIFAGLRAVYRSVAATGQLGHFDFFVLSDSTDPNAWIAEQIEWARSSRELGARGRLFYRRRRVGTNKKAGNIADFCRRWGRRYRYMVVLDADSFMMGATLVRLVRLMERNGDVGLLQTAPMLVRGETLYARVMQFAMRLYSPVFLAGLNYWQQGEGNYWGHNAIIRLAPFMEHCALPRLPGREPIGGKILSHDFVEAALLRRAGWAVWMLPDPEGSYEEGPPTLLDAAKRDRRWCQGNLQHTLLLFARGLPLISRIHFLLGILAYAASLVWLVSLLLGSLLLIGFGRTGLTWMPSPGFAATLGIPPAMQSTALLSLTLVLLLGPKLLAAIDLLLQPGGAVRFGGAGRMLASVFLESLFSAVQAPILMLWHSRFVVVTLLGRGVRWLTQQRSGPGGVNWGELLRAHFGHTVTGLLWALVVARNAPDMLPWLAPVLAGLVFSIPFSALTSRIRAGRRARRLGLFLIPEETAPPPGLAELDDDHGDEELVGEGPDRGLVLAVVDPYINALHLCLLRERSGQAEEIRQYFEENREKLLRVGPAALPPQEKLALLSDADSMDWLHRELWRRRPADLAPAWRQVLAHNRRLRLAAA